MCQQQEHLVTPFPFGLGVSVPALLSPPWWEGGDAHPCAVSPGNALVAWFGGGTWCQGTGTDRVPCPPVLPWAHRASSHPQCPLSPETRLCPHRVPQPRAVPPPCAMTCAMAMTMCHGRLVPPALPGDSPSTIRPCPGPGTGCALSRRHKGAARGGGRGAGGGGCQLPTRGSRAALPVPPVLPGVLLSPAPQPGTP